MQDMRGNEYGQIGHEYKSDIVGNKYQYNSGVRENESGCELNMSKKHKTNLKITIQFESV